MRHGIMESKKTMPPMRPIIGGAPDNGITDVTAIAIMSTADLRLDKHRIKPNAPTPGYTPRFVFYVIGKQGKVRAPSSLLVAAAPKPPARRTLPRPPLSRRWRLLPMSDDKLSAVSAMPLPSAVFVSLRCVRGNAEDTAGV